MLNLQRIRNETAHCDASIHLDNAGSALMPTLVYDRIVAHLSRECEVGGYQAAEENAAEYDAAMASLARLFDATPAQVSFQSSASSAWSKLFYAFDFKPGDRIITAFNEYCSNFVCLLDVRERLGVHIDVIGTDEAGDLDLEALGQAIGPKTRLIALSHVSSSSGQVHDVAAVGAMARQAGVPFLLDACQSAGQLPFTLETTGADMITGTARKFLRGPRGVGFMVVRQGLLEALRPTMLSNQAADWISADGYRIQPDARKFEVWERNVAAHLGFGKALEYYQELGPDQVSARIFSLADRLRAGLGDIKSVRVTDPGTSLCGIVTFVHDRLEPQEIKAKLLAQNIRVQGASVAHTRIDLEARGIEAAVRLSPHVYISEAEIDRALAAIEAL